MAYGSDLGKNNTEDKEALGGVGPNAGKPFQLPDLTGDLLVILSMDAATCSPVADVFRSSSHKDMPRGLPEAQAFVIHRMLNLYLRNPNGWRLELEHEISNRVKSAEERRREELEEIAARLRGEAPSAPTLQEGNGLTNGSDAMLSGKHRDESEFNTTPPQLTPGDKLLGVIIEAIADRVIHHGLTENNDHVRYTCTKHGALITREVTPKSPVGFAAHLDFDMTVPSMAQGTRWVGSFVDVSKGLIRHVAQASNGDYSVYHTDKEGKRLPGGPYFTEEQDLERLGIHPFQKIGVTSLHDVNFAIPPFEVGDNYTRTAVDITLGQVIHLGNNSKGDVAYICNTHGVLRQRLTHLVGNKAFNQNNFTGVPKDIAEKFGLNQ